MTEPKAKPKAVVENRYMKEAVVRGMHVTDQSIANVILDDAKDYTVQEARKAVDEWKKGDFK